MDLVAGQFGHFFAAVHGHPPFPWQQRLVARLVESDEWPEVLDLPTGAGKTAALDAAVFHLAVRASEPWRAALRIALVVDRRLVVDDAYGRARKICEALENPNAVENREQRSVVREVANRLSALSECEGRPLIAERLRGGMPLENEWVRTPTQPAILCSTVDQVGSRLLFRGYGVSHRMAPVHAGLLGENSLILIDEAHIAQPFLETLSAIRRFGGANSKAALLSATAGVKSEKVFRLSEEDLANGILWRRLAADKLARLERLSSRDDPARVLAERAVETLERLLKADVEPPAVGVVVNRVGLAREAFSHLQGSNDFDAVLMIGRSRAVERDRLAGEKLSPFKTGSQDRAAARPMIVVATQCIEVGVDLDLDGLVTQVAPLDSLRQRFGRLNRDGRFVPAEALVVGLPDDLAKRRIDAVYGDRVRATWDRLEAIAENGKVNFGIGAFDRQLGSTDIDALASPRGCAPMLMPAYLHLWAQTSPIPVADPSVELFLHGKQPPSADVSLVWRGDIRQEDLSEENAEALAGLFSLVPPRASEAVQVPLWAARKLLGRDVRDLDDIADVSAPAQQAVDRSGGPPGNVAFRWAGRGDARTGPVSRAAIRPGDVLICSSEVGGCDPFGWSATDRSFVEDLADEAAEPFRGHRLVVRVGRDVVREDYDWARLTAAMVERDDRDTRSLLSRIVDLLPEAREVESLQGVDERPLRLIRGSLEAMKSLSGRVDVYRPYPPNSLSAGGVVLAATSTSPQPRRHGHPSLPATEDDSLSNIAGSSVSLDVHSEEVASIARDSVKKLGLADVAEDLALAAYLHDAGKADRRFQAMLAGGDEWNVPDGLALAKSVRWVPGAWRRAGLPDGWRHEAQSVRLSLEHPRFSEARDPELVLWLVGTHHGLGRPFFGFREDRPDESVAPCLSVERWGLLPDVGPQSLAFTYNGGGWSDLFESLKQRYGIWGLAHMEAILRLADHRASEGNRKP